MPRLPSNEAEGHGSLWSSPGEPNMTLRVIEAEKWRVAGEQLGIKRTTFCQNAERRFLPAFGRHADLIVVHANSP